MGQLLFKKVFHDAIREGRKRTTIRRWSYARVRADGRAFCPGLGWLTIQSVETIRIESLTKADALADGFATLVALRQTLAELYPPQVDDGKHWFRVEFELEEQQKPASPITGVPQSKKRRKQKPRSN